MQSHERGKVFKKEGSKKSNENRWEKPKVCERERVNEQIFIILAPLHIVMFFAGLWLEQLSFFLITR